MQRALATVLLFIFGCDAIEQAQNDAVNKEMKRIEKQVADDQVKQYDIAKRSGDKIQACVQAGIVKAAFLQAKDEGNYKKWMATEKADCAAAGMPSE